MHQKSHREFSTMPFEKRPEISKKGELARQELDDEQYSAMKKKEHASKHQYKGEGVIHDLVEKASHLAAAPMKKTKKVLKKMYASK